MPSNRLLSAIALSGLLLGLSPAPAFCQPGYAYGDGSNQSRSAGQPQGAGGQYLPNNSAYPLPPGQYPGGSPAQPAAYPPGFTAAPSPAPWSMPPAGSSQMPPANPAGTAGQILPSISIGEWFARYDQIRHQAQMSPAERQRADSLMSRGLSILIPGDEKQATRLLLGSLCQRYQRAGAELKNLPMTRQTQQLHRGYYQYFTVAGQLFADYVRVQDNLFLTDATTGQPLAAGLLQRKQMLEALEHSVKDLDLQVRQQYGIAPYPY